MLQDTLIQLKRGLPTSLALYKAGILNENEYRIFSKAPIDQAVDLLLQSKQTNVTKFRIFFNFWGFPLISLVSLLASAKPVKDMIDMMNKPMVEAGAKPAEVPEYLIDC